MLHVDERLVSGEGRGVAKLAGQRVIGGSRNASHADAYIKVEVVSNRNGNQKEERVSAQKLHSRGCFPSSGRKYIAEKAAEGAQWGMLTKWKTPPSA